MNLTQAQLATLKADLAANANTVLVGGVPVAISDVPHTTDNAFAVAAWYNLTASPAFVVWRTNVLVKDCKKATTWTEYIGRSQGERDAWSFILSNGVVDASDPNVRQGIQDIFSGSTGVNTRTALTAIAKRDATNGERVFASGTGSAASPATMGAGAEGTVSYQNIDAAWALPD